MQWGTQYAVGMQYAVGTQYTVGVSAKRSTHTVDSANMGGVDLPLVQKVKLMQWGMQYAIGTRYAVDAKKVNSHSLLSKYGWWELLPLVQKGHTRYSEVCSMQ